MPEATLRHQISGRQPKKEQTATCSRCCRPLRQPWSSTSASFLQRLSADSGPTCAATPTTIARPVPGYSSPIKVRQMWIRNFLHRHPISSHRGRNVSTTHASKQLTRPVYNHGSTVSPISSAIWCSVDRCLQHGQNRLPVPTDHKRAGSRAQRRSSGPVQVARDQLQDGNAIKCIRSGGQVLPPLIITRGKGHMVGEHRQMEGVPTTWHFAKSANGWTSNELAVQWVETIFDPNTRPSSPSNGVCSSSTDTVCTSVPNSWTPVGPSYHPVPAAAALNTRHAAA